MSWMGEAGRARRGPILVFWLLGAIFVCAAAYHVFAMTTGDHSTRPRHAVFVAIDLTLAVALVRRPPGLAIAFTLLCGQQMVSHGSAFVQAWRSGKIDWLSLAVMIGMLLVLALLVRDARERRARGDTSQRPG